MKPVDGLAPALLWERFYEISQIPRPSKHEERIRLYLKNFAATYNLPYKEDRVGNIVIQVPPNPGFEHAPIVVLQSHVDMVCEKNKETVHDFSKDPIKLVREGEWIKADSTTLGADNGIGVAAALAIAIDDSFRHGPIELLFTVDEETGLTGANNLEKGFIEGKYLLNLDTEEDGYFYVGCAGGMDSVGTFKIEFEENQELAMIPYLISVNGLKGGHSGINIADGKANAIKILALLLNKLLAYQFRVAAISGGSKRNAIAREAETLILIKQEDEFAIREQINTYAIETLLEYKHTDSGIKISFEKKDGTEVKRVFKNDFASKVIDTLIGLPHGVVRMSAEIPGLVETSTNLATVVQEDGVLRIGTSQRSSIDSAKKNIAAAVKSVFNLAGAEVAVGDGYPGWQPNLNSNLLKLSNEVYSELFGAEPEYKAVHAGLECGILGDKYPGLDMISFGPTIVGAHSPDEKVNVFAVEKFYRLLKGILIKIAKQR